jgi:hypothetical protein
MYDESKAFAESASGHASIEQKDRDLRQPCGRDIARFYGKRDLDMPTVIWKALLRFA